MNHRLFQFLTLLCIFFMFSCSDTPDEPIVEEEEEEFESNSWTLKKNFPLEDLTDAVSFSLGSKLYVGTGYFFLDYNSGYSNDFYEYNSELDAWKEIASLPSHERESAIAFSIGSFGYVGLGKDCLGMGICDHHYFNDLWRYNPENNSWEEMAEFPGTPRAFSTAFVIDGKAYITGGSSQGDHDLWEYNPTSNKWTQKSSYPGNCSSRGVSFSINGRGFVGFGWYGFTCKDLWEYIPTTDTWIEMAEFPGEPRYDAFAFSLGNIGFVTGGINQGSTEYNYLSDLWKYEPNTNQWIKIETAYPGRGRVSFAGGVIGSNLYLGLGSSDAFVKFPFEINEFWQYKP